MLFKTLLITLILVAIIMIALSVKLLFDKKAEFTMHSCKLDENNPDRNGACSHCEIQELSHPPEPGTKIMKKNLSN